MQSDKERVALTSIAASGGMTIAKAIVGVLSGSLALLSEAAHSALDFAATVMTYYAVRISGKPADRTHLYGHGKVENLSALLESLLLFVTCGWIIYEAARRLFFHKVEVEVTVWMASRVPLFSSSSRCWGSGTGRKVIWSRWGRPFCQ